MNNKYFFCIIFLIILTTIAYLPLLKNINSMIVSDDDWTFHTFFAFAHRNIITEFKQLPLRTHLFAGGFPLIAYPRDWGFNPFSFFTLVFGEVAGLKLIVFILFMIGALGMFYLTKNVLGYNYLGALFSSSLLVLSSWGAWHVVKGNVIILFSYISPLLIAFYLRSIEKRSFIILASIVLSLIITVGSLVFFPLVAFFSLFSLLRAIKINSRFQLNINFRYIRNFLLIVAFALLLSAVKIIPMSRLLGTRSDKYFHHYPEERSYDTITTTASSDHFFNAQKLYRAINNKNYSGRLTMYFGPSVIFFFFSLLLYRQRLAGYFIILTVFVTIMFGPNSPIDIYKFLWSLHPYFRAIVDQDRYFLFYIIFIISLVSGMFWLFVERKKFLPAQSFIACAVLVLTLWDIFSVHQSVLSNIRYRRILPVKEAPKGPDSFFHVSFYDSSCNGRVIDGEHWFCRFGDPYGEDNDYTNNFYPLIRQGIGVTTFCDAVNLKIKEYAIPKYIIDKDNYRFIFANINRFRDIAGQLLVNPLYRGEVFLLNNNNASKLVYFSPDKILVSAMLETSDTLVVNQNYHEGWKVNTGKAISYNGLLAVNLPKGSHNVRFSYCPLDFWVGLIISIATLMSLLTYLIMRKE